MFTVILYNEGLWYDVITCKHFKIEIKRMMQFKLMMLSCFLLHAGTLLRVVFESLQM